MKKTIKSSLPAFQKAGKRHDIPKLLTIMADLRAPSGCPWDREQTEQTLKRYLIEEAYEVLEAIETGTSAGLKDELGDLLLQIVFLSQIADEKGQFSFADVVHNLVLKLIRRHPHIFPSSSMRVPIKPQSGQEVRKIWRKVKAQEAKNRPKESLLDGLPLSLPALVRAQRMGERAARVGFDWPGIQGVWEKIREEMDELKMAEAEKSLPAKEREVGDLLFTIVNLARHYRLSAEEALRKTNRRFADRFRQVESTLRRQGRSLEESSLEEMDRLWNQAKKRGKRR